MRHWPLWCLFLGSLAIRLIALGHDSLWYDEAFTASLAHLPLPQMLMAIRGDVHPPLFYMIEWAVVHPFGGSEWMLRLPSAIFSAAASAELWQLVKHFAPSKIAWLASILYIAMPGQQYYAQEARMYSLLSLLVFVGMRAALERNHWRLAPTLALIMYTQNLGVIYAAVIGGIALWQSQLRAFIPGGIAVASWLPWLPTLIHQAQTVNNGFWIAPGAPGGALYYLTFTTFYARIPSWLAIHAMLISVGASAVSLWMLRSAWRSYAPLALLGFAPPALLESIHLLWRPVLIPRLLIPSGAAVVALWAAAYLKLNKSQRWAAALAVLPMIGMSNASYYLNSEATRYSLRPSASEISQQWQAGDAIYHMNLSSYVVYDYYLPSAKYPTYVIEESGSMTQSLSDSTKLAMGIAGHERNFDALAQAGYRRAWLFYDDSPLTSNTEQAEANRILKSYPILSQNHLISDGLDTVTVYLLDLAGGNHVTAR